MSLRLTAKQELMCMGGFVGSSHLASGIFFGQETKVNLYSLYPKLLSDKCKA